MGIDAAAGTVSLAVVMWVAYLDDVVGFGTISVKPCSPVLPVGDVCLPPPS